MVRAIKAHEATIKTATVEVKVLTISGRQVTLAVFRQLKEERILNPETLEFAGVPWGYVNYHIDCKEEEEPHLHVVWQKGDELRRSLVSSSPWSTHPTFARLNLCLVELKKVEELIFERDHSNSGREWFNARICEILKKTAPWASEEKEVCGAISYAEMRLAEIDDEWEVKYKSLAALDQLFIAV